jgi:hypothetical protein
MTSHCGLTGYDTVQSGKWEPTVWGELADWKEEEVRDLTAK